MRSALSHAWKSWLSAKGVAVLAAIALAVGIGSSTAIYTVVNAVMLRPLPYPQGERFVALYGSAVTVPTGRSSHRVEHLIEYQRRTRSFDVFGWFTPRNFNLSGLGAAQHVDGAAVTPSLAHHVGVNPLIGRWFQDDSGVVISHALWRSLGADPTLIGKPLTLNGRGYTLTGVMPPGFRLPLAGPGGGKLQNDIWVYLDPAGRGQERGEAFSFCYARRKPGVTLAQAEADVKRVAAALVAQDASLPRTYTARLDDLHADAIESIRPTLLLLFAAAGLLLLIACANVAGLLLTRSIARARETAVRVALGAGQRALALQYFVEGLIVSIAGAAAGVAASLALVRLVVSIAADYIPRADEIAIDWRVLLFAVTIACLASALSSLAPFWQATRTAPADVLRGGVRATAGLRSRRLSRSLVVAEIALAFTLIAVSAVLIAHLGRLTRVWPGFDADHLLAFQVTVSESGGSGALFSDSQARVAAHRRLIEAIAAVPGVSNAAIVNQLPLDGCCIGANLHPEGARTRVGADQKHALLTVSPDYLRTMRIPLRSGRFLTDRDGQAPAESSAPGAAARPAPAPAPARTLPAVINETAARMYWPDRSAIGAIARLGSPDGLRFEVVGIVGDVRNDGLSKPTVPEVYLSSAAIVMNPTWFLVRSTLPPSTLVPAVRQAIRRVDPAQPIHGVTTMRTVAQESVALERVGSLMLACFALAALLMATLGVYGVIAYAVRQGRSEIGMRMALGAMGRDVLFLFLGSGMRMVAYGVAFGAIAVAASAWLLIRAFHIPDLGWLPFVYAASIVTGIALVASFFPAWRATRISPMIAIRGESAP